MSRRCLLPVRSSVASRVQTSVSACVYAAGVHGSEAPAFVDHAPPSASVAHASTGSGVAVPRE